MKIVNPEEARRFPGWQVGYRLVSITSGRSSTRTPAAADDAAWLRNNGTLILTDTFDREEDGNLAAAIGNGWNSATANRVPDIKQADLDDGVLKVTSAVEAGHQAHIHHEAGFEDGGAVVRFKLPGLRKHEALTVGFVDRQTKGIHAGRLCYAIITNRPIQSNAGSAC